MRSSFLKDFPRNLDSPAVALSLLLGLMSLLAVLPGAMRLGRAASMTVSMWSAVRLGDDDFGGVVGRFPDTTAASTGFTSIPTARALIQTPRWLASTAASSQARLNVPPEDRLTLAVVGLPVDVGHGMLRDVDVVSYCLARQQSDRGILSLCRDAKRLYERFVFSGKYNLCDFDPDCWHSTAVAILASGRQLEKGTLTLRDEQKEGDQKETRFETKTIGDIARSDYETWAQSQGDDKTSFKDFFSERFTGYEGVINVSMPIAEVTYNASLDRTYITKQMIVDHGVRSRGPILAMNVFSRFESAIECDAHRKKAPCVLTTTSAQEKALEYILEKVVRRDRGQSRSNSLPALAAIVIVAGGELTDRPCDDTATARLISKLRQQGVLTFVPVGNDSNATKLRFPACASQAISVGSLTRDGTIAAFSNGSKTAMVDLYVDGETVVLPIRGPRLLPEWFEDRDPAFCGREPDSSVCHLRVPGDQYDTYLAGGTLLSAAVASGVFLNLRERHPSVPPEAILRAFKPSQPSSGPKLVEANEQLAERALDNSAP
jgi:hypothetical protein